MANSGSIDENPQTFDGTKTFNGNLARLANAKRITTAVTKTTSTTIGTLTGLTFNLEAGKKYIFRGVLHVTATANGGVKVANSAGTATATSTIVETAVWNGATIGTVLTSTTLTNIAAATEAATKVTIEGEIIVNAGGTFIFSGAQNASHADTTTFKVGSYVVAEEVE